MVWDLRTRTQKWMQHLDLSTDNTAYKAHAYASPTLVDLDGCVGVGGEGGRATGLTPSHLNPGHLWSPKPWSPLVTLTLVTSGHLNPGHLWSPEPWSPLVT